MEQKELFFSLVGAASKGNFDDTYLLHLIEFWKIDTCEADGNIFYALYALHFKNYEVAIEYAEKALKKRKVNLTLWRVLRDCYLHLGNMRKAFLFAGYADKLYEEPVNFAVERSELQECMDVFSFALGHADYAPMAIARMQISEKGTERKAAIFGGEFLPEIYPQRSYHIWSGVYTEQEMLDYKGILLEKIKNDEEVALIGGADFTFDLIKAVKVMNSVDVTVDKHELLVPLLGMERHQKIDFFAADETEMDWLGKWTTSFFRLNHSTKISSDQPFMMGEPIELVHSPKRKKVVLNILVDALCWRFIKERNYDLVPNILNFFQHGVIFNDHNSVAEYTYPSFATIATGMYPQHSQIYVEKSAQVLDPEYVTISEQMKKLGYYCVNIMGCGEGVYDGNARGYDRLITSAYAVPTYIGVERTIHHLEAFQECDQFLMMHTMDAHPWGAHTFQLPVTTQTRFELKERSMKEEKEGTSVHLPNRPIYYHWNAQGIQDVDNALKKLFDYITSHYDEDEYIIQLYSDHGVPVYNKEDYVLSKYQTGAAYMVRGAGIPAKGLVDELTSAVDIYPTLAHCVGFPVGNYVDGNLPEVFGGKARDYTVSVSMYPGTPFRICIRTREYECRAKSNEMIDEDGRTDLDDMVFSVYRRDNMQEIQSPKLNVYFRKIIDDFTRDINNHGMQWPEMRAKREEWYTKER